jgi:hypothetical protein
MNVESFNCNINDANYRENDQVITFKFHMNNEYGKTVIMHHSGNPFLCPVHAWAAVVMHTLACPPTDTKIYIKPYQHTSGGNLGYLPVDHVRLHLRAAAQHFGTAPLGFLPEEISTHSIRSGTAMAMYLVGIPSFIIMLIGGWSSNTFLCYISCCQVQEFSASVSSNMLLPQDDLF